MTAKTTEIGQMTWGIMRGVMAMASQKVEEYTKENPSKNDGWPRNETQGDGFYQGSKGWNSNGGNGVLVSSSGRNVNSADPGGAWDDWDNDGYRKHGTSDAGIPSNNGDAMMIY